MARSLKTVKVRDLIDKTNKMLAYPDGDPYVRQGMINLLVSVLHDTGNYNGFRYLSQYDLPSDIKPGIRLNNNGAYDQLDPGRYTDTDSTRIQYF